MGFDPAARLGAEIVRVSTLLRLHSSPLAQLRGEEGAAPSHVPRQPQLSALVTCADLSSSMSLCQQSCCQLIHVPFNNAWPACMRASRAHGMFSCLCTTQQHLPHAAPSQCACKGLTTALLCGREVLLRNSQHDRGAAFVVRAMLHYNVAVTISRGVMLAGPVPRAQRVLREAADGIAQRSHYPFEAGLRAQNMMWFVPSAGQLSTP